MFYFKHIYIPIYVYTDTKSVDGYIAASDILKYGTLFLEDFIERNILLK